MTSVFDGGGRDDLPNTENSFRIDTFDRPSCIAKQISQHTFFFKDRFEILQRRHSKVQEADS
jgi:hypothetical protein